MLEAEEKEQINVSEEIQEEVEFKETSSPDVAPKQWYIIQTYSGFENRVKIAIDEKIKTLNLQNKISRVLVPEEEVIELRNNKRIERIKKLYPGYVFIEMILDEQALGIIKKVNGVSRFIGEKGSALPISEKEIQRVLRQIGVKEKVYDVAYTLGESIRIISGPFRGNIGGVENINAEKNKLRVLVSIFGRETPVELNFDQVEKME